MFSSLFQKLKEKMQHFLFLLLGSLVFAIGFCQLQTWEYARDLRFALEICNFNKTNPGDIPTFKLRLDMFSYGSALIMIALGVVMMGFAALLMLKRTYNRFWSNQRGMNSSTLPHETPTQ
jgi:hypothetical protein